IPFLFSDLRCHNEDALVSFHSGAEGKPYASIAAGCFDDGTAGFERTVFFGSLDHRDSNTVFDTPSRILVFDLREDLGFETFGDVVELYKRGIPDKLNYVIVVLHEI